PSRRQSRLAPRGLSPNRTGIYSVSFGAPNITVVGLKPIAAELGGARFLITGGSSRFRNLREWRGELGAAGEPNERRLGVVARGSFPVTHSPERIRRLLLMGSAQRRTGRW